MKCPRCGKSVDAYDLTWPDMAACVYCHGRLGSAAPKKPVMRYYSRMDPDELPSEAEKKPPVRVTGPPAPITLPGPTPQKMAGFRRFLVTYLRHAPGALGLKIEPGGWVNVDILLRALEKSNERSGAPYTEADLEYAAFGSHKHLQYDRRTHRIRARLKEELE